VGDAPMFDLCSASAPSTTTLGDRRPGRHESPHGLLRERGILKGDASIYVSLAHTAGTCASRSMPSVATAEFVRA